MLINLYQIQSLPVPCSGKEGGVGAENAVVDAVRAEDGVVDVVHVVADAATKKVDSNRTCEEYKQRRPARVKLLALN